MASMTDLAALLPPCAVTCLISAITNSTCAPTDQTCICSDVNLNNQAAACIAAACNVRESLTTKNATSFLCGMEPNTDYSYVPILIVFICLAAVVVAMRCLARFCTDMSLWWDDWANFTAMFCCIAYTAYALILKNGGLGIDLWAVPLHNITDQLLGYWVLVVLYIITRALIRVSIILFYLRIFRSSRAARLIWGTLFSTIVISVPIIFAGIFQCAPVSYFWWRWDGEHTGYCFNVKAFIWAAWIIHISNDVWLMMVPLPLIAKLQLTFKKKLLISVMFCMGILVVAVTIYKLTLIESWTRGVNPTYEQVPMMIWAGIEIDLGVICACMPSLPVLFRPAMRRLRDVTSKRSADGSGFSKSRSTSHYGIIEDQGKKLSKPVNIGHGRGGGSGDDNDNNQIKMVTTIHQSNGPSESETCLHPHEAAALELGSLHQGNVRVQAWS
ncbi:hypothetical protein F4779DRAFT_567749 [Xylariaceae sp. FL0662B]|nr:hypothetical protein F4779DRAFT_567749 [Xylariaceae sp. FL0662B]